jgi:hypothetical protein
MHSLMSNPDTAQLSSYLASLLDGSSEELLPGLAKHVSSHDGFGWSMLRHPLVYSVPYSPLQNRMLNASYEAKRSMLADAHAAGDLIKYVYLHERPYRLNALLSGARLIREVTAAAYWDAVGSVWRDSENVHELWDSWRRVWLGANRSHGIQGREHVMSRLDYEALQAMPDVIEIFHGEEHPDRIGMSWTLDEGVARWFAKRFTRAGRLYRGRVRKSDVIAYFTQRGEEEILVAPELVMLDAQPKAAF